MGVERITLSSPCFLSLTHIYARTHTSTDAFKLTPLSLCITHSLVTLSHPSFPTSPCPLGSPQPPCFHTHTRTHTPHPHPPSPSVPHPQVHPSMSWQKYIHAARACVHGTKRSSSLMLLFLDEAKTKRRVFQRETSEEVCELLHRTDYRGLKGLVWLCVFLICLSVMHITQGQKLFFFCRV